MKRFLAVLSLSVLVFSGVGWAQTTGATPTSFATVDTGNVHLGQMIPVAPYFMADNRANNRGGTPRGPVAVVAAWSTNLSADSSYSYYKNERREFVITISTWVPSDSTFVFTIREYSGNLLTRVTTQAVNYGTTPAFPAPGYGTVGTGRTHSDFGDLPIVLNLQLADYATVLTAINWEYHLYLWDQQLSPASIAGVIATLDTLYATSDTFYTDAVPGNYGYATLLIDKTPTPGTADILGLGYQVAWDSAGPWYGDLFGGGHLFIMADSLSMPVTDTTMAIDAGHILAPWVRYGFYGKSALRFIAAQVRLIWRD